MKQNKMIVCLLAGALFLETVSTVPLGAQEAAPVNSVVMPTGDMAQRRPSKPMEMLSSADAQALDRQMADYVAQEQSLLVNKAETYYYYERLDPLAKEIYDVMYGVAQDPVSEGNIGLMMTVEDPQGEVFYNAFNVAYRAVCFDHPELFWLYAGEEAEMVYLSEALNQNGFYFVYIKMEEPFLRFGEQMQAFNNAAEEFLADIDTGISEYDTIRQIHDKLIELVNYNDPVVNQISFDNSQDLAHTAYGCLVTDSSGNPNYAVCDGYTLAFEYLLQQCGINVVFIGGNAGNDEASAGGHAWNVVEMDGSWYEVDCTWDDSGSQLDDLVPGTQDHTYISEALSDPVFRERLDHFMFLISTDRIRHFVPGEEYTYTTKDQMYLYQMVSESVHIRLSMEDPDPNCDSEIISLAPMALQNYFS